jgi:choline dehydrogenase
MLPLQILRSITLRSTLTAVKQTNRNNVTYVTGRQSVAEFMSNAAEEVEGIKVQSLEHLTELLERDLDSTEYRYKRGIYGLDISMTEDRRRSSSRNNVINTMREGFPLTISTHSLATRILLDKNGTDVVAHGVEYLKGEGLYSADPRYDATQKGELKE